MLFAHTPGFIILLTRWPWNTTGSIILSLHDARHCLGLKVALSQVTNADPEIMKRSGGGGTNHAIESPSNGSGPFQCGVRPPRRKVMTWSAVERGSEGRTRARAEERTQVVGGREDFEERDRADGLVVRVRRVD